VKQDDDSYQIDFSNVTGGTLSAQSQIFDAVVLAAPHQFADIDFIGGDHARRTPDKIPYVELHVTLFTSPHLLSPAFFNLPSTQPAPKVILTTLPTDEEPGQGPAGCGSPGFFSISLLDPVTNPSTNQQEYLYKIFSPSPPNSTFLARLLGLTQQPHEDDLISKDDITWIYRKVWHSYPYEYPRVTFEEIRLDDNLWYTSGIESFISTMETSALAGMNVAKLIVDQWQARLSNGMSEGWMRLPETSIG